MEKVRVSKATEAHIHLEADGGILMEIGEFFTFFAPGYKYMPSYRDKRWDGKIRIFDQRSRLLPFGLLFHLSKFCKNRGYDLELAPGTLASGKPEPQPLVDYLESLTITAVRNGEAVEIEPRDYQIAGWQHAVRESRCMLISPTGSGKSLMIYMLLRWFLDHAEVFDGAEKVLIVVPTTSLVEQMYKDFAEYALKDQGFDAVNQVHRIYSGKEKYNFKSDVVVTTWQSAIKLDKRWFLQFGMVIGDEAHTFKAQSLQTIMSQLVSARYRIGTTGTLDDTQVHELVLTGCFGPAFKVITTKELIDSDTLADLKIQCIVLKHEDEVCRLATKLDYKQEIDFLVTNHKRNKFIAKLALGQKGNTLVLYNLVVKHGRPLYALISELAKTGRKVFFVSGGVDTDERERIRQLTEKENDAIIVASLGTFSTGINIRNLHNIVFASPTKSQIKVLQSIGRGLRKSDNGQGCTVFDISDDLSWKKTKNTTLNHAVHRVKIYSKEKFTFKVHEVPFASL